MLSMCDKVSTEKKWNIEKFITQEVLNTQMVAAFVNLTNGIVYKGVRGVIV